MTQEGAIRLHAIERALAVMYALQLGEEEKLTARSEQDTAWMLGILRAWDQVHTLLETGQVKQFPYERAAVAR
jgi:hypothetical protein